MSLSLGEERMEAVKKELDEVIKFYRELQKISLPAKIIMISDAAEGATERFVPKLNAQLLKKWNQRANNVKKDNENFANFEFGVCETMAASGASVVFKEVHKLYRKLEWIVNHTAEIIALILETLQIAGESEKTDELWQDIKGAFVSIFTGDWSKVPGYLAKIGEDAAEIVAYISKSAVFGVIAIIFEGTLAAVNGAAYVKIISPVLDIKKACEEQVFKSALPQGSKRRRAIKPSKRN